MVNINPDSLEMTATVQNESPLKKRNKPTTHVKKDTSANKISFWGKDNLEPQHIMNDIRSVPAIRSVLALKGKMLYGLGCFLGAVEDKNEHGFEVIKPIKDEKIEAFLKRSYFEQQIRVACANYFNLENPFSEIILTKDRKQVYSVNNLKAAFCRWGKQNDDGIIEKLYYHSDWRSARNNGGDSQEISVLNEFAPLEHLRASSEHKLVYRYRDNTPDDRVYYQEPVWNSIRTSEWLEVAKKIPVFKSSLFDNQASVKYHIQTSKEWWEWKYKGFMDMSMEDRIKIMNKERSQFENTMTGTNGAGKALFSTGYVDKATGNYIPGWKIDTLTNKFGSADYIEDMQEATAQIFTALNFPPTLAGISPGKKFGAGSGSDIREAYNMYMAMQEMERDLLLEPWYTAMEYNGYPSDIRLVFRYPIITTLDKNSETKITDHASHE